MNDIKLNEIDVRVRCLITDTHELAVAVRKYGVTQPASLALCCAIFAIMNALVTGDRHDD